jgi:hypothetical protein
MTPRVPQVTYIYKNTPGMNSVMLSTNSMRFIPVSAHMSFGDLKYLVSIQLWSNEQKQVIQITSIHLGREPKQRI